MTEFLVYILRDSSPPTNADKYTATRFASAEEAHAYLYQQFRLTPRDFAFVALRDGQIMLTDEVVTLLRLGDSIKLASFSSKIKHWRQTGSIKRASPLATKIDVEAEMKTPPQRAPPPAVEQTIPSVVTSALHTPSVDNVLQYAGKVCANNLCKRSERSLENGRVLLRCVRCHEAGREDVNYCGLACQRQHWSDGHAKVCKKPTKPTTTTTTTPTPTTAAPATATINKE